MTKLLSILFTLFAISPIMAQNKQFTLDDLIPGGKTYYSTSVPENSFYTWWGDACIELNIDECHLIEKDYGTKSENIVFKSLSLDNINKILEAGGRKTISNFYDATFPFLTNSFIVLSHNNEKTIIDWLTQNIVWTCDIVPEASNLDWSKSSLSTAYTIGHNLFVMTADGIVHQVSNDGNMCLVYGESVHRDEFGISKGTFWNPDGSLLAFYKMDQSMVSQYPQVDINPIDESQVYTKEDSSENTSRCAAIEPDPYPMAGEASHKVSIGIFNPANEKTIYLNTGDPTDRYFTNITWSPDGTKVYLIELNRDQNEGKLDEYDAFTGDKIRTIFTESNEKYFEPLNPIQFLPWDSSKFIYQTRKDGFNHIYLYSISGKLIKQLTNGEFEVAEVLGFNKKQQRIVFTSNEKNLLQRNLFSVDMRGNRLLLGNGTGWHNAVLSTTGKFAIDTFSSPIIPKHIDIVSTLHGGTTNIFAARNPWSEYDVPEIKVGSIKADDGITDLYYRLILPTNFDPSKKYPAIVYVYGGPHAHNIDASRNWGARGWDIWMAQKGYVMFCLDNRGSENRGLEFEQATFRNLGVEEMKDQIKGVDFLKSLPYVDSERLGIHGWSFGGFMTSSLMTTYPDVFKVGVAGGPVIDWKYYEVMYGERYMDTPQTNPEGYKNTSLLNKADKLQGRLMIIYGGNDPVCVPQHTLSFVRACIDAGTYPDLFTYPGDGHNMTGTDRVHLHNVITRYFEDHLK